MPELPEVETTRRKIEPHLLGRTILSVSHDAPQRYRDTQLAEGRRVTALGRRGKYLLLRLAAADAAEDDLELVVHLGMTGGFRLTPGSHTRVTLTTDAGELYFQDPRRFGFFAVLRPGEYAAYPTLARMGPEPLDAGFSEADFVEAAARAPAVKPWLLSQVPVAGVGNIYADESLWRAKIHPLQRKLKPAEARRLHAAIREVMGEALAAGGSTLSDGSYAQPDGEPGGFRVQHHAYDRAGEPCARCGTPIQKTVVGQRGTHFCPHCQTLKERP